MPLRLVQSGRGEQRDLVVVYHLTAELDRRVREAAGDGPIVVNDTHGARSSDYYLPPALPKTVERARELARALAVGRVVLVGYSAGVAAVRAILRAGAKPDAVVTIDGTHASLPVGGWQLDVWRELASEARAGRRPWVATHTMLTYVEQLPRPYASTWRVLQEATGWELQPPARRFDGALHVWSYPGADRRAHEEQAQHVLPEAVSEALRLLGAADGRAPAVGPAEAPRTGQAAGTTLAAAVLAAARADLAAGVREDLGRNDGHRIREYAEPFGVRPPCSWCAIGTSTWVLEGAADLGVEAPVAGSAGARALAQQFRVAGRLVEPADIRPEHLIGGNAIFWRRGDLDDPREWRGHAGLLRGGAEGGMAPTLEPNSGPLGDRVAEMERPLADPALIGIGLVTTPAEAAAAAAEPEHEPTELELEELARLLELGAEVMRGEDRDPLAGLERRLDE